MVKSLYFERTRLCVEITAFMLVLLADAYFLLLLLLRGQEAIIFYITFLRLNLNPGIVFLVLLAFSLYIACMSLRALVAFVPCLRGRVDVHENGDITWKGRKTITFGKKSLTYARKRSVVPSLTLRHKLLLLCLRSGKSRRNIPYEYLVYDQLLLDFLSEPNRVFSLIPPQAST